MECIQAAIEAWKSGDAPLAAVEGFVRQILGWREFVNGVYWLKMPDYTKQNALNASRALPDFFYTGKTEMNCVRSAIRQVVDTGYNHHIQRLMVLGNFLLLAEVRPQEALRWFTEMYVDAYDWVMAANVIGMALHADGGFMATKPYAGAGAYISKMSNYCRSCQYRPTEKVGAQACPFNLLYWAFYDRHQERFAKNPRTSMMIKSWRSRDPKDRSAILRQAEQFLNQISSAEGESTST
jgi:deoxyribodipyrimidine photolyase-related protein